VAVSTVLEFTNITPAIGAIASGVDLRNLDSETFEAIRRAVLERGVVFFRDQELSREDTLEFMSNFGEPCLDPFVAAKGAVAPEVTVMDMDTKLQARQTALWHSDTSGAPAPTSFISLRPVELPPTGGDTCWSSMYAAYDALSEPMRNMLDGLKAVHSAAFKLLPLMPGADHVNPDEVGAMPGIGMRNVHPVVRVHPETGRNALFVNETWTERIVDVEPAESDALLAFLFAHVKSPLFTMRWRWRLGDIVVFDNYCTQHSAVNDYDGGRVMQKSMIAGDRPYGPR
jgi:alpha-ketoglutarate-dependent taurine dioxygenase